MLTSKDKTKRQVGDYDRIDLKDGKIFLNKVTEKIRTRLTEVDASIEAGQKDIQSMNEYYWENYTEMDEYGYEELR